jgi:hypothetical protein
LGGARGCGFGKLKPNTIDGLVLEIQADYCNRAAFFAFFKACVFTHYFNPDEILHRDFLNDVGNLHLVCCVFAHTDQDVISAVDLSPGGRLSV